MEIPHGCPPFFQHGTSLPVLEKGERLLLPPVDVRKLTSPPHSLAPERKATFVECAEKAGLSSPRATILTCMID